MYYTRIYQAPQAWTLGSAILRTCREIYSEAVPVLYGENIFVCFCWTLTFNFAAKNVKYLKHLVFEVDKGYRYKHEIAAEGVAEAIQYFVKQGGNLRTFELALNELEILDDDEEREHNMLRVIADSQNFMTALSVLNFSETLAISIWYRGTFDLALQSSVDDELQDLFEDLIGKKMNAIKQGPELIHQETSEVDNDSVEGKKEGEEGEEGREGEEGGEGEAKEEGDEDDEDEDEEEEDEDGYGHQRAPTTYKLSWSLHPQRSEQQSAKVACASD